MAAALSQGAVAFNLLLAGALTLVLGLVLARFYRRAVARAMRRPGEPQPAAAPDPPARRPAGFELRLEPPGAPAAADGPPAAAALAAQRRFARAALVYALGGAAHAAVATVLLFRFGGLEFYFWRSAIAFWAHAWPVVLVLNLFLGPDRRWQAATVLGYLLGLLLLSLGLVAAGGAEAMAIGRITLPGPALPLLYWLITAAPGAFLLLFLNRRIRSIGPLLLVMMVVAVIGAHGAFLLMHLPAVQAAMVDLALASGVGVGAIFGGIQLLGFALFLVPGWLAASWLRRRYERKRISDQMIAFDAFWLLMTLLLCSRLATEQGALGWTGLLAFVAYLLVVRLGLRPLGWAALAQPNARLLLLRVFGAQRRSERLYDLFNARWRYRGSMQLIGGPDLATSTLEPHEFLDFLSGRLARNFIHGAADLERRMATLDLRPDPDGRFRVNELFCDDAAWRPAVGRLMAQSEVVVMDLRGFSAANRGCIFELQALIDRVPLDRLVVLIDRATDVAALRRSLLELWPGMSAASPNAGLARATLQVLTLEGSAASGVTRLLARCDRILADRPAAPDGVAG
jgi:hypothetical protein